MSFGQGINIKLYSGQKPWDEQFYSSTCDSLYMGGQHGGARKTNCPYIKHDTWGLPADDSNSNDNLQSGRIDHDFFNKWFKSRPADIRQTAADAVRLGFEDSPAGFLAATHGGAEATYWNTQIDGIEHWAQKGNKFFTKGYPNRGGNGWDWALQSCRQEYGAYLNPSVKCDDPVCQMEKVAQTNPVYFESGCDLSLSSDCVTSTVAKAVAVPIIEAVVGVGLTIATGGLADGWLLAGEAAAEGAGEGTAVGAGDAAATVGADTAAEGAEGVGDEAVTAGERTVGKEAEKVGEKLSEKEIKEKSEAEVSRAAEREAAAEKNVEENSCEHYKSGGLARSGAIAKRRLSVLERAESFGAKAGKDLGKANKFGRTTLGIVGGGAIAAGISGVDYAISGQHGVFSSGDQSKIGKSAVDLAKQGATTAADAYHNKFESSYQICVDKLHEDHKSGSDSKHDIDQLKYACRAKAMQDAQELMNETTSAVGDVQAIGADVLLAQQWAAAAGLAKRAGGLASLRAFGTLTKDEELAKEGSLFGNLKGAGVGRWGGAASQAIRCNIASGIVDAVQTAGAGLLADSIAHEDCYTCRGQRPDIDKGTEYNPLASGIGIKPENPWKGSPDDKPIPAWSGDVVKPYCFIPNRRGAESYCPIFGDTLKFESDWTNNDGELVKGNIHWPQSNSTDYQKYKGAILGTTDFEMPNKRPFWTLNDTQSRVQTGKQGLHTIIEGDTPPDVWNQAAALLPAVNDDPGNLMVTDGGRLWTNYGYVCNYNNTDDFVMNPLQAQNFLDMTVGPINTTDISVSGMRSSTCAEPLIFKDIQKLDGKITSSLGNPETVYARTACMGQIVDPIPINTDPKSEDKRTFKNYTLEDKINWYYNHDIVNRVNVLGQGMFNEHYQANTIPVPSDPNISYNQNFRNFGGNDVNVLLPDSTQQYTGALPWFQDGTNDHSSDDYQLTFDADNASYKLPATFWYEHDTFNKIMSDYCIRKGPKIRDISGNYDRETATAGSCLLKGGVESNAPGLPGSPNAVRTYCPNMFLNSAGISARGPASQGEKADLRDGCYNCSQAELHVKPFVPRPTDVCARWYKGMIDSYKNLSNITKQNPTQIFKEYHKAVDEYCNIPSHRDLVECSCHNADNINNPTEYNNYFQTWSSFETANMGTKGMKYCWLTPCVANTGGFDGFENEDIINFKDPAAYVNAFRQMPNSPWVGKCPDMACEEFLIYTDNTKLTDDHINMGIHACGGDTVSNEGYICGKNDLGEPECRPSGRYISNTDPEYSQTRATCIKKCLPKGPSPPPCIEHYYICKDGELQETYDKEYSQFWSGHETAPGGNSCDKIHPHNAPPDKTTSIIDVSNPGPFTAESKRCQTEPFLSSKDTDQVETNKEIILIIIVVMTALLMILLTYLLMIKPYLYKKIKTSDRGGRIVSQY